MLRWLRYTAAREHAAECRTAYCARVRVPAWLMSCVCPFLSFSTREFTSLPRGDLKRNESA